MQTEIENAFKVSELNLTGFAVQTYELFGAARNTRDGTLTPLSYKIVDTRKAKYITGYTYYCIIITSFMTKWTFTGIHLQNFGFTHVLNTMNILDYKLKTYLAWMDWLCKIVEGKLGVIFFALLLRKLENVLEE
jgi:hypothetical protein